MRLERPHPAVRGFEGTALLPGPESRLPIRAREGGPPVLTVVPYYPAFPPEMVFPRTPRTDEPAAVFRENGRSRVAYFAGDVDRTFWRSGSPDLGQLLVNTVHWLRGDAPRPLSIEGDGIMEAFAWETEPGRTASEPENSQHQQEYCTQAAGYPREVPARGDGVGRIGDEDDGTASRTPLPSGTNLRAALRADDRLSHYRISRHDRMRTPTWPMPLLKSSGSPNASTRAPLAPDVPVYRC